MPRGVFILARMCERSLGHKFSKVSDQVYFLYEVTVQRTFQNLRCILKSQGPGIFTIKNHYAKDF